MSIVEQREISIPLGIIVEKRASAHPWADWIWKPVAVFMNADEKASWREMSRDETWVRYHAATVLMTLHRKETEALRLNLMLPEPELYVVLQENEDPGSEFPYDAKFVTASSYDAQDFHDAGDDIIEKVAMPDGVAALIQAFVEEHHVEETFKKRRRDRIDTEELKFGKTPIFTPHTRQ